MYLPETCERLIMSYLGIKYKKKCKATLLTNKICNYKCDDDILCLTHKKMLLKEDNCKLKLIGNLSLMILKTIYKYNKPDSKWLEHKLKIKRKWDYFCLNNTFIEQI